MLQSLGSRGIPSGPRKLWTACQAGNTSASCSRCFLQGWLVGKGIVEGVALHLSVCWVVPASQVMRSLGIRLGAQGLAIGCGLACASCALERS